MRQTVTLWLALAAVTLTPPAGALAQEAAPKAAQPDTTQQLVNHLEFAGYTVTREGSTVVAKHPTSWTLSVKEFQGGLLVSAYLAGSARTKEDRAGFLELINTLNTNARGCRYYADKDSDLAIEAWYPGEYDKPHFSAFLDNWKADVDALKETANAGKFLK
jgi:hypothetical protein